jgi:hypothetical protein
VQKGKVVTAAMAATAASSQKKPPHPVLGEKDDKGKMLVNSSGKMNCFNCGCDNHWVINFPDLTAAQRDELVGMAHVSVGNKEFKGIGFLQNESVNPHVRATQKTLDPCWLYLNSTSSFHQVFMEEHLDNLLLTGATLRANCNAGTNFATKKGWHRDLFDLWLVCNGMDNLLSLPQLEVDGFTVSYHTRSNWIVTTPCGKEITFLQEDIGVCRGFLYIDMQSMDTTVAMIQTIHQHYKGFTKHEVKDAFVDCKAQAMTGLPTDAQFVEMVRNNTIKNCFIKPVHITNALTIFSPRIA